MYELLTTIIMIGIAVAAVELIRWGQEWIADRWDDWWSGL